MSEFRADRIATLYFFHPLQRLLRRSSAGVPILMYHSISDDIETHILARTRRCFGKHLKLLARNGYKTIGLGEAVRKLEEGTRTTEELVVQYFR